MARFRPGHELDCDIHRKTVWLGHVVCELDVGGCGAIYKSALTCELICGSCDHRLLSSDRSPKSDDNRQFTGRAMCPLCFQVHARRGAPVSYAFVTD